MLPGKGKIRRLELGEDAAAGLKVVPAGLSEREMPCGAGHETHTNLIPGPTLGAISITRGQRVMSVVEMPKPSIVTAAMTMATAIGPIIVALPRATAITATTSTTMAVIGSNGAWVWVYGPHYYAYGDDCWWLRRQALATGSQYWWSRYNACISYY
jgi:hypothetical protein